MEVKAEAGSAICENCKGGFDPKRPHQRFCCDKCRWAKWNEEHPRMWKPKGRNQ